VLALGITIIAASHAIGRYLQARGHRMFVNAPPLTGNVLPRASMRTLICVGIGAIGVTASNRVSRITSWRLFLLCCWVVAIAWSVGLAAADGADGFLRSPLSRVDYSRSLHLVHDPLSLMGGFVGQLDTLQGHAFSHPPGMLVVLWVMSRVGLAGPWWEAVLGHVAGSLAIVPILVAVRSVAGEQTARNSGLFLALLPAAVFFGSVADPVFMLLGASGICLAITAAGHRPGLQADARALASGLILGTSLFFSYGLILLIPMALVLPVITRRYRTVVIVIVGSSIVVAVSGWIGLWWLEAFLAARPLVLQSVVRLRPYPYFLLANIGALLIAVGPAVWLGSIRARRGPLLILAGSSLALMMLANLSGMSKGEVERIWLPFLPWLVPAAVAAFDEPRLRTTWLLVQVMWTIGLQVLVRSPW
jgi:hypothetical protein